MGWPNDNRRRHERVRTTFIAIHRQVTHAPLSQAGVLSIHLPDGVVGIQSTTVSTRQPNDLRAAMSSLRREVLACPAAPRGLLLTALFGITEASALLRSSASSSERWGQERSLPPPQHRLRTPPGWPLQPQVRALPRFHRRSLPQKSRLPGPPTPGRMIWAGAGGSRSSGMA